MMTMTTRATMATRTTMMIKAFRLRSSFEGRSEEDWGPRCETGLGWDGQVKYLYWYLYWYLKLKYILISILNWYWCLYWYLKLILISKIYIDIWNLYWYLKSIFHDLGVLFQPLFLNYFTHIFEYFRRTGLTKNWISKGKF